MNKNTKQRIVLLVSGLALIALGILFESNRSKTDITLETAAEYSEQASNLAIGTKIEFYFASDEQEYSYERTISETVDSFVDKGAQNISANSNMYLLHSIAALTENNYIDVELQINKTTNDVSVSLFGAPVKSEVYLTLNGDRHSGAIPVDWAGKMEFVTQSKDQLAGNNLCLVIGAINAGKIAKICHHVTKNERQVPA